MRGFGRCGGVVQFACGLAILAFHSTAWGRTIYVAAGGSGDGSSAASPLGHIQDGVNFANPGDTVQVAGGVYRESVTVTRSGTAAAPILITSQPTGAAVIKGTQPTGPFTHSQLPGVLAPLLQALPCNALLAVVCELVQPYTSAWQANVPVFNSSNGQGDQCFAGGTRLVEARWPYTPPDALSSPNMAVVYYAQDQVTGSEDVVQMAPHLAVITLDPRDNRLPAINWTGARIRFTPNSGYQQVDGTVLASAGSTLTIQYSSTPGSVIAAGSRFYLFGIPGALQYPGQFVRDNRPGGTGHMLVRAPNDVDPNTAQIECKQFDYAFNLSGQQYVTVDGFTIVGASITTDNLASGLRRPSALGVGASANVAPANHITLSHLSIESPNSIGNLTGQPYFQWTNSSGVILSGAANVLQNSTIRHADGNAVSLAGRGNQVLYNTFLESNLVGCECADVNTGYVGAPSVLNGQAYSAEQNSTYNMDEEIAYNYMERSGRAHVRMNTLQASAPRSARVHHNLMSGAVLQTADDGAVYAGQTYDSTIPGKSNIDQTGVEVDHNRISASTTGIYPDNFSRGWLIHHNIILAEGDPDPAVGNGAGMIVNGAMNHTIANNTVVLRQHISAPDLLDVEPVSTGADPGVTVDNNVLVTSEAGIAVRLNALLTDANTCNQLSTHNTCWYWASGSDPLFTNLGSGDVTLQAGSPAIDTGVVIPGITDDARPGAQPVVGSAPDRGALEGGVTPWVAGPTFPDAPPPDTTPPSVTFTTPADGDTFAVGETVPAAFSCADNSGGSGIAYCSGDVRNRDDIDTCAQGFLQFSNPCFGHATGVGFRTRKTLTVTAVDYAGNITVVTHHYDVLAVSCVDGLCK